MSRAESSSAAVFWRPGTVAPGSAVERDDQVGASEDASIVFNANENVSIAKQRRMLPIFALRSQLLYCVEHFQCTIIVGATGCGKTTQLPQYLDESGWTTGGRQVVCTQPRRVAATTVAARVAVEMNTQVGREVGYAVRFDECADPERTRIKFVTDGMLLRECLLDPLLSRYSVVMIDEAHERSLHTDILLGLLKKICKRRRDLRVIVSSATLDAEKFAAFFETNSTGDPSNNTCTIVSVDGRQYPVDILYSTEPCRDYVNAAVDTAAMLHERERMGDILVFLTGQEEVEQACTLIRDRTASSVRPLQVMPIYAGLLPEEQMKVFRVDPLPSFGGESTFRRRCIVATNIAETSVTIPNTCFVVDCGFAKVRAYNARTGIESLVVTPISQASANQRAGRAGRVRPGRCYRLFTERSFQELEPQAVPEMQRSNLAWVLLTLKALGIDNLIGFDFVSPPPRASLVRALELLYSLGALDDDCRLTSPIGATMAEFPVEPRLTRVLLAAGELGCSEEMLSIAACVSVQNVYHQPRGMRSAADAAHKKFAVAEGDHLTLLNIYNSFVLAQKNPNWCHDLFLNHRALSRAVEIRGQLRRYCRQFSIPLKSCENSAQAHVLIRKAIVAGFFANAAQLQPSGAYKPVRGGFSADDELHLHPTSVLSRSAPEWVVYHEVVLTSQKFMRDVTVVEPMWLCEIAPHFYEHKSTYVAAPSASSSSSVEKKEEVFDEAPPIKQRKLGGWV